MSAIKLGWAKREISIDEPVSVSGQMYLRVSEGILDPLYATALCVDGGEGMDRFVFLSLDLAIVYSGILQPIEDGVRALRPDFPANCIVANATHTHSAPGVGGSEDRTPDGAPLYPGERYKVFLIDRCVEAVVEAWDNRAEGAMGFGYGYAVVAHSRRVVYFKEERLARNKRDLMTPNGYAVMYGNTNSDIFSHYEAGADHFLNLMFTFDAAKKLTGIVVNVPCPSQLSETFTCLSADYWADVRQLVAQEFGPEVYVLPQCAAAGDLSPRVLHYKEAQVRRMTLKYNKPYDLKKLREHGQDNFNKAMSERADIAQRIMEGIREVYSWASKDLYTHVPVRHTYTVMDLQRRPITDAEVQWCEENLQILAGQEPRQEDMTPEEYRVAISRYQSAVRRNKAGIERAEDVKKDPTWPMGSHTIQIGDICFATIRFELYHDFMHRLQARSPFMQTFVVQLAGTEGGNYLATRRGAEAIGYSASMFCNMVSADGGQQWVENSLKILEAMKKQDEENNYATDQNRLGKA